MHYGHWNETSELRQESAEESTLSSEPAKVVEINDDLATTRTLGWMLVCSVVFYAIVGYCLWRGAGAEALSTMAPLVARRVRYLPIPLAKGDYVQHEHGYVMRTYADGHHYVAELTPEHGPYVVSPDFATYAQAYSWLVDAR